MVAKIEEGIREIRKGNPVIVVDDEARENEGDFIAAAEKVTPRLVNFMAEHGRGLICVPLTQDRLEQLDIPVMVQDNTALHGRPLRSAWTPSRELRPGSPHMTARKRSKR